MNKKGFTLIELLIVVAIIGIVAAIAIPNLLVALQKGKQKATMGDMRSVGVAIESYITDWSQAPNVAAFADLQAAWFIPFYIKIIPINDGWGGPFEYLNADNTDLYSIASAGRNGNGAAFVAPNPAIYDVTSLGDFNNDICFSDGQFTCGPRVKR